MRAFERQFQQGLSKDFEIAHTGPKQVQLTQQKSYASAAGKAAAPIKMSKSQQDTLEGLEDGIKALGESINKHDPSFTGPIQGRTGSLQEKSGFISPEEATFRSIAEKFKNALIKARSGAAVSQQEMERMIREVGSYNMEDDAYLAVVQNNLRFLKNKKDRYREILRANRTLLPGEIPTFDSEEQANLAGYYEGSSLGNRVNLTGIGPDGETMEVILD